MAGRGFVRGREGVNRIEQEAERARIKQEQRDRQANRPFRFRMPPNTEDREFIVLDDAPDFFLYEHSLKDPSTGKWGMNVTCCRDYDTCPVCESSNPDLKESTYNMVLTVIDLEPYTRRDGTTVEFSRKLLVVKPRQHRKFVKQLERGKTLRGALFTASRGDSKTSAIGDDIQFLEYVSEDDLSTYVREWTDREGKAHSEDCSVPLVYEECFDEADPELLRRLAGAAPVEGSSLANESVPTPSRKQREAAYVDDDDDADEAFEEDEDDLPFDPDEAEEAEAGDDTQEEEVLEEEQEEAPAKRKSRVANRRAVIKEEDEAPKRATRRAMRRSKAAN